MALSSLGSYYSTRAHVLYQILHTSLEGSFKSTQSELDTARTELSKQKSLNEKLETDLLALESRSAKPANANGTTGIDDALAGLGLDLGLETTKKGESSGSTTRSTPIPFTSSADTSILPIVTSQRDRFRARNAELEEVGVLSFSLISECSRGTQHAGTSTPVPYDFRIAFRDQVVAVG